jgi:hypothetical protein
VRLDLRNYRSAQSRDLLSHLDDFQNEVERPRRVIDPLPRFGLLERLILTELVKRLCNELRRPASTRDDEPEP